MINTIFEQLQKKTLERIFLVRDLRARIDKETSSFHDVYSDLKSNSFDSYEQYCIFLTNNYKTKLELADKLDVDEGIKKELKEKFTLERDRLQDIAWESDRLCTDYYVKEKVRKGKYLDAAILAERLGPFECIEVYKQLKEKAEQTKKFKRLTEALTFAIRSSRYEEAVDLFKLRKKSHPIKHLLHSIFIPWLNPDKYIEKEE